MIERRFGLASGLVFMVVVALGGCSKPEEAPAPKTPATSPGTPPPPAAVGSGAIIGRVSFSGTPPPVRSLSMSADPYCASANQGDTSEPVLVVDQGGGLGETFVYVKSAAAAAGAPEEPVVIDQERCRYRPRVVGVQVDQPLEFRNSDTTLHNVHAVPELSKGFNIGMPTKGMKSTRKFSSPEVFVRIKCDVHPWMAAYVGVVPHPYFTVTESDGAFRIANVPAGEQTVEAAHPTLGTRTETVMVPVGGEVTVDFTFAR